MLDCITVINKIAVITTIASEDWRHFVIMTILCNNVKGHDWTVYNGIVIVKYYQTNFFVFFVLIPDDNA